MGREGREGAIHQFGKARNASPTYTRMDATHFENSRCDLNSGFGRTIRWMAPIRPDVIGSRTLLADATGRYTAVFDPLDRLGSRTNPANKRVTYVYDGISQRRRLTDPDGGLVTTVYDAIGEMTQVVNAQSLRTTFAYDPAGRRTVKKLANTSRTSFTFDNANRVTRLVNIKASGVTISSFGYQYDKTTRRTGVTEATGDRVTWTFDPTYQLVNERRSGVHSYNVTYTYDPIGNRTVKTDGGALTTSTYDVANRLTYAQDSTGRTTFVFDAAGNQIKETSPTLQVTTSVWDFENLNKATLLPDSSRVTSVYDGDKLRVEKDTTAATAKFIFDGQNILLETDGTNLTQAVYTLEPNEFGKLVSQRQLQTGIWVQIYYAFDALGSTDSLTDSSAVITDTYTYFAFGLIKVRSGTTFNRFDWVGELLYVRDAETGKFHLHVRPLDPLRGRFQSPDPKPTGRRPDQYPYAKNDPINFSDPGGLEENSESPLIPATLSELPTESMFSGVTGWPKAARDTSNTAAAKARKKIRDIIGDWNQEKSFSRAPVDELFKKGLAIEQVSMKTFDGGTVIRKYVAIPRDDGGVDTLTLKSVWPLLWGKFHYETESYKHGVTPKVLEKAQEARDEQAHQNYMTVHGGIIKIQTAAFSLIGPVTWVRVLPIWAGADLGLTGVRDLATLEDNETATTTVVALGAKKYLGADEQTAVEIGRGVHFVLFFAELPTRASTKVPLRFKIGVNEVPPEFLSGEKFEVTISLPERVIRSEGSLKNPMGDLEQAGRQARTDPAYGRPLAPSRIPAVTAPTNRGGLRVDLLSRGQPPAGMRNPNAHHDLPWEHREWMASEGRGLNVNDSAYGRWVEGTPPGGHQRWTPGFRAEWDAFIEANPNASRGQVLDFLNRLRADPRFQ